MAPSRFSPHLLIRFGRIRNTSSSKNSWIDLPVFDLWIGEHVSKPLPACETVSADVDGIELWVVTEADRDHVRLAAGAEVASLPSSGLWRYSISRG